MSSYLAIKKNLSDSWYELPPPKRDVEVIASDFVDSARNTKGVTVGQKVGRTIFKINEQEWPWLTAAEWATILGYMSDFHFYLRFVDPRYPNKFRYAKFYCGDRSAKPYWLDSNSRPTHYTDCKVNFVDTGYGSVTDA